MSWKLENIDPSHDVSGFDCGEQPLNSFLQKNALNNDRAGLGRTFVAIEPGNVSVVGYFTVSAGSVRFDTVPDHKKKRLPRYPIPTVHIGRLARDLKFRGKDMGEWLLIESLRKAVTASSSIGAYVVDVIALHQKAKSFYLKYGFVEMLDDPLHLFLPIKTAIAMSKMI